jgi:hypothetical protein
VSARRRSTPYVVLVRLRIVVLANILCAMLVVQLCSFLQIGGYRNLPVYHSGCATHLRSWLGRKCQAGFLNNPIMDGPRALLNQAAANCPAPAPEPEPEPEPAPARSCERHSRARTS